MADHSANGLFGTLVGRLCRGQIRPWLRRTVTFLALGSGCIIVAMLTLLLALQPPLQKETADWAHLAIVGFLLQSLYFGMCNFAFRADLALGTRPLTFHAAHSCGPRCAELTYEKVGWRQWAGLDLGLLGAAIVMISRPAIERPSPSSFLLACLTLLGITGGSSWEKRSGVSHHPVTSNLVGCTPGLNGVMPSMLLLETMHVDWTWGFILSLAYLVFGTSLIAVGLLLAMIRAGDMSRVSALFCLVLPLAALVARVILGEIMPFWLGRFLAAVGVYIATYGPKNVVASER